MYIIIILEILAYQRQLCLDVPPRISINTRQWGFHGLSSIVHVFPLARIILNLLTFLVGFFFDIKLFPSIYFVL